MRILHLLNTVEENGNGIHSVALDLAWSQQALGHQVAVVSGGGGAVELLHRLKVEHLSLNQQRRPLTMIKALRDLGAIINIVKPDVVHAHVLTGTVLAYLHRLRRDTSFRLVTTVHNEYQRGVLVMALADRCVGVSQYVTDAMHARGVPRRRLATVLNGCLGSPRRPGESSEVHGAWPTTTLLSIGSLCYRKGTDLAMAAFDALAKEFSDLELVFVGNVDWPEAPRLRELSPYRDRVHFYGFDAQPQRYLRKNTIFVHAAREEPFGLVLLEARAKGTPIVAAAVGGIPEVLEGGKSGLLVEPGNAAELSAGIRQMLTDHQLRSALARSAAENLEWATVTRMASEYISLYEALLDGRRGTYQ